jgi:hypothetical protein
MRGLDKFIYLLSLNRVRKERTKQSKKEEQLFSHSFNNNQIIFLNLPLSWFDSG